MYSERLFLFIIWQFDGERTVSGIYHLLKGKKTSQSIQDSYLYHLHMLYHSCEDVDRQEIWTLIRQIHANGWIRPIDANGTRFVLSTSGNEKLQQMNAQLLLPDALYMTNDLMHEGQFWLRLQLLIQTVSALNDQQSSFLPITKQSSVTEYVRHVLLSSHLNRAQLKKRLYQEMYCLLAGIPVAEANCLAAQLSGARMSGLTLKQIANETEKDLFECRILFKSALRRMMNRVSEHEQDFPIIRSLWTSSENGLSSTAHETLELLRSGLSIQEAAVHRKLAPGTIEDHLVEIVLKNQTFDLSDFMDHALEQSILDCAREANTKKLKEIKRRLHDKASYLQIRLVLAKHAGEVVVL
ncbi:helix-turn-helix domain-containing protein [Sporolactobacillus sp. CPB3-1]|uniref:Helix-turn-helix domain-containing protein n=1 Tax=Sporolactobacillus mangiferae TaxID=2940498 RepID=A0ABT0MBZ1_9BACL|nr:helix-turn-helix domain-containing protein [Sporolactobacillus mangiferae]MCL1631855.1 helix-turn-helix domain-containing protein [Sporolactobacillus mangiferae]